MNNTPRVMKKFASLAKAKKRREEKRISEVNFQGDRKGCVTQLPQYGGNCRTCPPNASHVQDA